MHSEPYRVNGMKFAQCRVCGQSAMAMEFDREFPETWRCFKHRRRNPCAIEGCTRSRDAGEGALNAGHYWVCGEHWKIVCPPNSKERRTYLRFFRIAKKMGREEGMRWPVSLENRYWRFWHGLIRRGRKKCAGDLDMTEINRLFGWDQ